MYKPLWPAALISILSTIAICAILLIAYAQPAESHRPIGQDYALRAANRYVHDHFCGAQSWWKCTGVSVPLVNSLNSHYYEWEGTSFRECKGFLGICIKRRVCRAKGRVNGHTGQVKDVLVERKCRK